MQYIVILFIKFYRRFLSPLLPRSCRFYPTCSSYCLMAIEKYGLLRGSLKGMLRILRCNPFHPGGYDPIE